MPTSDTFAQLALRITDPVQHHYEVIRGIMLADETVVERSRITGVDWDTVSEKAHRFLQEVMFGLVVRGMAEDRLVTDRSADAVA